MIIRWLFILSILSLLTLTNSLPARDGKIGQRAVLDKPTSTKSSSSKANDVQTKVDKMLAEMELQDDHEDEDDWEDDEVNDENNDDAKDDIDASFLDRDQPNELEPAEPPSDIGAVDIDPQKAFEALGKKNPDWYQSELKKLKTVNKNYQAVSGGDWNFPVDPEEPEEEEPSKSSKSGGESSKSSKKGGESSKSKSSKNARDLAMTEFESANMSMSAPLTKRVPNQACMRCMLSGGLVRGRDFFVPRDRNWRMVAARYNRRIRTPQADIVVMPNGPQKIQQIQVAVKCARQSMVPVQARAGGHSYAGFSSGEAGQMLIDLRWLETIRFDKPNRLVYVEGGVKLGALALALASQGYAVPHGDCPSVGLAGHALHGGFGYASRKWGLSTDAIVGLDVVTSTGDITYCDKDTKPRLYWAMRGAGESFGIVTKFYLKARVMPKTVYNFEFDFSDLYGDPRRMAAAFSAIQGVVTSKATNQNVGLTVRFATRSFAVHGYYFGTQAKYLDLLSTFANQVRRRPVESKPMSYIAAVSSFSGGTPLLQTARSQPRSSHFYAKSLMPQNKWPLRNSDMIYYFDHMLRYGDRTPGQWIVSFRLLGGAGSAVSKKENANTFASISRRKRLWVIQHDGFTSRSERAVMDFITSMNKALVTFDPRLVSKEPSKKPAGFLPFVDPMLSSADAHDTYYPEATQRRLSLIKKKYDFKQMFRNPQSIEPS